MNERIKEMRKALKLTQSELSERIGISRSALTKLESGENIPANTTVSLIVREFNVNEHWLRTGEGEMFVNMNIEDEVAAYLGKISGLPKEDPRYRIVMAMAKIPEQYWPTIREILDILADRKAE